MQIPGHRFLVTGGAGFVGSHIVDRLLAAGAAEVVVLDLAPREHAPRRRARDRPGASRGGDVGDRERLAEVFEGVDGLFHAAVLPLNDCTEDPRQVPRGERRRHVQRLRRRTRGGREEDRLLVGLERLRRHERDDGRVASARRAHAGTARARSAARRSCARWATQTGIEYVILRYMNVYGPRQEAGLVRLVLNRINAGEPPIITGDGSASFDFVHVGRRRRGQRRARWRPISRASSSTSAAAPRLSVKEIVGHLLRLTGSDLEPEYRPAPQAAMFRRVG